MNARDKGPFVSLVLPLNEDGMFNVSINLNRDKKKNLDINCRCDV